MILKTLTEVIWSTYQTGKPDVESQTFRKPDVEQLVIMATGNAFRELYYASRKVSDFNTSDYSFLSPLLTQKKFVLPPGNIIRKRRIDMSEYDLFRLPKNSHFTNVYPEIEEGCGNQEVGEITQVSPGEENFYINDPDYRTFQFYVVKGRGLDTYNIPDSITHLLVEAPFVSNDIDITLDVAYEIGSKILLQLLKTQDVTGQVQEKLREDIQKAEGIK